MMGFDPINPIMDIPSNISNQFGEAHASGDGITFQAGVNTGTININQMSRNTAFPKAVYDATFDAANKEHVPSCLPGTRVDVLKEIQEWIDGDHPRRIYWLNGMAGTGKSTIALTIARTYRRAVGTNVRPRKFVRLGGTFFFSRGGGDLASASRFAATIAIQLTEVSLELRKIIGRVVDDNPRLDSLSVQEQWERLIIEPLAKFYRSTPTGLTSLLFVVDALDECNSPEDVNVLIQCLERVTRIEGAVCRVFLTSRPDQPIKLGMDNSAPKSRQNFVLHDIEKSIVDQDLALYYRNQLSRIKATISPDNDPLSERTIKSLVERSHGLFIHAATVCRFVQDGKYVAVERLTHLVESQKSESAEQELDKMYTTVLDCSFVSMTDGLTSEEVKRIHQLFQRIIGAIIVMSDAMNLENLAQLLGERRESIDTTLRTLHSVIKVPERHDEPIQIVHPSFREFLLDAKRCTNIAYSILADDVHGHLGTRCFDILMTQLKQNPFHIKQPGSKAQDTAMDRLGEYISVPLQYSSRYWWVHFKNCSVKWQEKVPLPEFLKDKYLLWLECLAWMGQLGQAVETMKNLNAILLGRLPQEGSSISIPPRYQKSNMASTLSTVVTDALRFLLTNRSMVEEAPLQIYASALLFSPRDSQVRVNNYNLVPKWILNKPSTPKKWGHSSQSLLIPHTSQIHSVAVSSDSRLIATACADRMVHIWDALSGTEKLTLERNTEGVPSVSFSPDGCLFASLVRNTVSMWNIRAVNGRRSQPDFELHIHSSGHEIELSYHSMCAFSPDGCLFAATSSYQKIWVWNISNRTIKFHTKARGRVGGIYFSSDGSLLIAVVSNTEYEGIEVWDLQTGRNLTTPSSMSAGNPVGFLSGTKCVILSSPYQDDEAQLVFHDARTGANHESFAMNFPFPIKTQLRPGDGKLLLASAVRNRILVWALGEWRDPLAFESDSSTIERVVFSPNGKSIISSNDHDEVRVWNIEEVGARPSPIVEMYQRIRDISTNWRRLMRPDFGFDSIQSSYEFEYFQSPDGNLLATHAKHDLITTIWNAKTGREKCRFNAPRGHNGSRFSPDGKIFAVLAGAEIHFWETATGRKGDILRSTGKLEYGHFNISPRGGKVIYISQNEWEDDNETRMCEVWGIDGLREISHSQIQMCSGIGVSPNEKLYCAWSHLTGRIIVGDFANKPLKNIARNLAVKEVKFTPDNKQVCILGTMHGAKINSYIWNIEDSEDDIKWLGPQYSKDTDSNVSQVSFSRDGKMLAILFGLYSSSIELYEISSTTLLHAFHLDFWTTAIRFSPSGTDIITDRGPFRLPDASPLAFPQLFATLSWIQEDGEDILAIPSAYRDSLVCINGHTVTFFDSFNGPLFVRLDEGKKTITW